MSNDLLESASQALAANDQTRFEELAPRLAERTDDDALELLLEIFKADWHDPKKSLPALISARHPQASARIAARVLQWLPENRTAMAQACRVLAGRGDASALPALVEATAMAKDDNLATRALLIARVALGDAEQAPVLRERFVVPRPSGEDRIAEYFIQQAGPEPTYDFLAPIVRAYQAGDDAMGAAATKALFHLVTPPSSSKGFGRSSRAPI